MVALSGSSMDAMRFMPGAANRWRTTPSIGDTIRVSLTPTPGGDRTEEVRVAQQILHAVFHDRPDVHEAQCGADGQFGLLLPDLFDHPLQRVVGVDAAVHDVTRLAAQVGIGDLNDAFSGLSQSLVSNQALQAANLVGHEVLVASHLGRLSDGGSLSGSIDLPADALVLSSRNLPGVKVVADSHLTAYDALDCVHLLVSQEAVEKLEERLAPEGRG